VRLAFIALLASGCVYDELTATHVEAGGVLHAAIDSGAMHMTTALCSGKNDPATINGYAPDVTVGVVAGDDATGATAVADLAKGAYTFDLAITANGRNRLEVHADGSGCVANAGTIHFVSDGSKLGGTFSATGTRSDTGAACAITGDLANVPEDR
jgi:hypothetical protein